MAPEPGLPLAAVGRMQPRRPTAGSQRKEGAVNGDIVPAQAVYLAKTDSPLQPLKLAKTPRDAGIASCEPRLVRRQWSADRFVNELKDNTVVANLNDASSAFDDVAHTKRTSTDNGGDAVLGSKD